MIGGNVMHVEMSLDQMMLWRPLPELSGHRVPGADGLYLTGASTHRWRCVRSQWSQCGSNRTVGQPPGRDSSLDASFEQVVKVTRRTSPADTPPPR